MKIRCFVMLLVVLSIFILNQPSFAHSGRTDSSGGHNDNKNKSGLGSYHYHHGYGAHLHPDGICPYSPKDAISVENMPTTMRIGDSLALKWTVTYYSGSASVSWESGDSSILSVSGNGELIAKKEGKTTLTAVLKNGSRLFNITIKPVLADDINLTNVPERLEVGGRATATASITPSNTTDKTLTWASSVPGIAAVNTEGEIEALAEGKTTLSVTAVGGKKSSFILEVYEIYPESIEVNLESVQLPLWTEIELKASVKPNDTTRPDIEWLNEDEDIVTVDNGWLLGQSVGATTILVKCKDLEVAVPVNVYEILPEAISVTAKEVSLAINTGTSIQATVLPTGTTRPDVIWETSNSSILSIDQAGSLWAHKEGTAIVAVSCQNIVLEIPVEVFVIEAAAISFEEEHLNLSMGKYLEINSEVEPVILFDPVDTTYQSLTFISSDESVVQIDNGKLYAVGEGKASITAISRDAKCVIELTVVDSTKLAGIAGGVFFLVRKRKTR